MFRTPGSESSFSENLARKVLDEDVHYLTSVTKMGDVKEVVACEEVYSSKGIKLVGKGVSVDSSLRERLLNHVLLRPLDESLEVKNGVCAELLANEASRLIDSEVFLQDIWASDKELSACQELLRELKLPSRLAFKLTVAREQLPWLFKHSLTVVLVSCGLAQRLRLTSDQCSGAIFAGLMHDLGELHTEPSVLDRRHKMLPEELHYIDVHPITGYLIAKEIVPAHPEVAAAVLQHHEKLDGSGYPNRLRDEDIDPLAKIISVADACASIIARFQGNERLSALMRLNRQKLDPTLLSLLHRGLKHGADAALSETVDLTHILEAAKLLHRWGEISADHHVEPHSKLAFLFDRMAVLRVMLAQFGFNSDEPQSLQALIDDREIASELGAAFDEVRWQINDLQREIQRRRETFHEPLSVDDTRLLDTWQFEIREYLEAVSPAERAPTAERRRNPVVPCN